MLCFIDFYRILIIINLYKIIDDYQLWLKLISENYVKYRDERNFYHCWTFHFFSVLTHSFYLYAHLNIFQPHSINLLSVFLNTNSHCCLDYTHLVSQLNNLTYFCYKSFRIFYCMVCLIVRGFDMIMRSICLHWYVFQVGSILRDLAY